MNCNKCGSSADINDKYCRSCGSILNEEKCVSANEAALGDDDYTEILNKLEEEVNKKNNIKLNGWLVVFCIYNIIIMPIRALIDINKAYEELPKTLSSYPSIKNYVVGSIVLEVAIAFGGIMIGFLVKNRKKLAIKYVYKYLWFYLVCNVLLLVIPYMMGFPSDIESSFGDITLKSGTWTLIYFVGWYMYFLKSDCVKRELVL